MTKGGVGAHHRAGNPVTRAPGPPPSARAGKDSIRCATLKLSWRLAGRAVHKGVERVASCEVRSCEGPRHPRFGVALNAAAQSSHLLLIKTLPPSFSGSTPLLKSCFHLPSSSSHHFASAPPPLRPLLPIPSLPHPPPPPQRKRRGLSLRLSPIRLLSSSDGGL